MCGIIGYIGTESAQPILLEGLRRMEYRGYDSAGIATLANGQLQTTKAKGKIANLAAKIKATNNLATTGIGHTRWATHGEPSELNAHPHIAGQIALVHNGIIENYQELRAELEAKGISCQSQTDSEVLAWVINDLYQQTHDLLSCVQRALLKVRGTFGLAVLAADQPNLLIAARRGSPLQIGISKKGIYVASDSSALVGHVKHVTYLEDEQIAICSQDDVSVVTLARLEKLNPKKEELTLELGAIQKQGYDHFLLKEIMEQPLSVQAVTRGRLDAKNGTAHLGGLNMTDAKIRSIKRIIIVGCGTAFYAGLLGKYLIERMTHIPVDVEVASEYRYRDPVVDKDSVALFVSQSGETADTLACLEELKRRGVHTLGLINVVGSTIARTVNGGIYLHAGPEISVASTKAFTNQVIGLLLFGLHIARRRDMPLTEGQEVVEALEALPKEIAIALKLNETIKKQAKTLAKFQNAMYLGRDTLYPIALEGSHKLKEVSYLHAEAYPAGEMKHGANALIDKDLLVVYLLGKGALQEKSESNLAEVRARDGRLLLISDTKVEDKNVLRVHTSSSWTQPLVLNVVMQLVAYHVAVARGTDVDQPRNLAKSVTVE